MPKKRHYHQVIDGEWLEIPMRGFKEQCCDCGLVHRLNFKLDANGKLLMQCFRDGPATGGARSHFGFNECEFDEDD